MNSVFRLGNLRARTNYYQKLQLPIFFKFCHYIVFFISNYFLYMHLVNNHLPRGQFCDTIEFMLESSKEPT